MDINQLPDEGKSGASAGTNFFAELTGNISSSNNNDDNDLKESLTKFIEDRGRTGTPLESSVWHIMALVARGETMSSQDLAQAELALNKALDQVRKWKQQSLEKKKDEL